MISIQLLAVLVGLMAIYLSYLHYKRKDFNKKEVILWVATWGTLMLVALFPHSVDFIVKKLGFNRVMDLIMTGAFLVLFGLCFHNYVIIHRLEKKIEKLVRKKALEDNK